MGKTVCHTKLIMYVAGHFACWVLGSTIFGCQGKDSPAPFFNGLYLEYEEVFEKSSKPDDRMWVHKIRYRFRENKNGTFYISQDVRTTEGPRMKGLSVQIPSPRVGDNLRVDQNGIVLTGGDMLNFVNGYPSYLWLPTQYQKKGVAVITLLQQVRETAFWEGHAVWPLVWIYPQDKVLYYDTATGILLGKEEVNGTIRMVIKATNHPKMKGRVGFLRSM